MKIIKMVSSGTKVFLKMIKKKFESSPTYLYFDEVPKRIYEILPNVKLLILLRNPIKRALSHYWHEVKHGFENLPLNESIFTEKRRLKTRYDNIHFSYLSRGLYINQIKKYLKIFPRKNILIIKSEDTFKRKIELFNKVFNFLKISPISVNSFTGDENSNYPKFKSLDTKLQKYLVNFFFEPNNELLKLDKKSLMESG